MSLRRPTGLQRFALVALVAALAALPRTPASAAPPTLYTLPAATHAGELAIGGDGRVWFNLIYGPKHEGPESYLGRLEPDGTFVEPVGPGAGGLGAPLAGPGGQIWFGSNFRAGPRMWSGKIVRLDASGQRQEYSLGRRPAYLNAATAGRGFVWFELRREDAGGRSTIGRISVPADRGVEPMLTVSPDCSVLAMAAGGRALWLGELCERGQGADRTASRSAIVRIGPRGHVRRFPLPRKDHPTALAIGRDGTVWFGATRFDSASPRVGRITTAGDLAEYPVPDGRPAMIAVGPEGHLWFPAYRGVFPVALSSIDRRGNLGPSICLSPGCGLEPTALASAPDGALWFSARTAPDPGGGGLTNILEGEAIANEPGTVGRLLP